MESDLIQNIKSFFTTEFKDQVALSLDEQGQSVEKALTALIPAGLLSVSRLSGQGKTRLVSDIAQSALAYIPGEPDVAMLNNEGAGSRIPEDLLGKNQDTLRHSVARYAGIKNESAGSLIMLTMPVIMRFLGAKMKQDHLSSDGLATFLKSKTEEIKNLTPKGFEPVIDNILEDHPMGGKEVMEAVQTDSPKRLNKGWILPIILVAAAVLFLVFLSTR